MSVTETIKEIGFMLDYQPQDLEWYLTRGSHIHKATELYDLGTLDEESVDPLISGYLESYKLLCKKYSPEEIEISAYDPIYGYCGTLDRPDIDLKSGAPAKWHKIQAGAYWGLKKLAGLGAEPMSAVYLQPDGSMPKIVTYTMKDMRDSLEIFKCALAVIRTRKEML
jgi:hypothetical protein